MFVLVVTLTPSSEAVAPGGFVQGLLSLLHGIGVPAWFDHSSLEFVANIGMFVPLGVLLGLSLRRDATWLGWTLPVALTLLIEGGQALFLPERVADVRDLIANAVGGWIGFGGTILLLARRA